jgi:hypothetical protein
MDTEEEQTASPYEQRLPLIVAPEILRQRYLAVHLVAQGGRGLYEYPKPYLDQISFACYLPGFFSKVTGKRICEGILDDCAYLDAREDPCIEVMEYVPILRRIRYLTLHRGGKPDLQETLSQLNPDLFRDFDDIYLETELADEQVGNLSVARTTVYVPWFDKKYYRTLGEVLRLAERRVPRLSAAECRQCKTAIPSGSQNSLCAACRDSM